MLTVLSALCYLLIATVIYISDGWFDYFDDNNDHFNDDFGIIMCCIFWPATIGFLFGAIIKRNLKSSRELYDERKRQENRIRVAETTKKELELAKIMNQLEQELEEESNNKRRVRHV